MKNLYKFLILISFCIGAVSCDKDFLDPGSATETQVLTDVNGLIAMCNGLTNRLSVGRQSPAYTMPVASGLTTKEMRVLNAGNADEDFLEKGGANVQGNNSVVRNIWEQCNIVKSNADLILKNSGIVTEAGTKAGIDAFAQLHKAMALGIMATFFEQGTLEVSNKASFLKRDDLIKEAIKLLESAASVGALSSYFTTRVVPGIDIVNTANALIARYSLMIGDNDKALAAASKVDLTKKSSFNHDDVSRNAIFEAVTSNRNVVEPTNTNLGIPDALKPDAADKRLAFFLNTTAGANLGRASFYTGNGSAVPIYRPGEMILIKAEVLARKNNIADAITELNKVLTKKAAGDAWGIGADLPAYSGASTSDAVLTEIYRQRCIELFMTGLRLDDARRFNRPAAERSRNFYPYPLSERDNNSNTPADPAN